MRGNYDANVCAYCVSQCHELNIQNRKIVLDSRTLINENVLGTVDCMAIEWYSSSRLPHSYSNLSKCRKFSFRD